MLNFLNDTFQFCLLNLCRKLKLSFNLTTLRTLPGIDSELSSVLLKRSYPKCRCAEFWEPLLRDWGWPIVSFRRCTNNGKLRPLDQTAQVNKGPSIIFSSGTSVVATMAVVSYSFTEAAQFYLLLFGWMYCSRFHRGLRSSCIWTMIFICVHFRHSHLLLCSF